MIRRGVRLEMVAGLGIALSMPALAWAADGAQGLATQTTLTAETRDQGGRTKATVAVTVSGEDGLPATGVVVVKDHGRDLSGAVLDAAGQTTITLPLPAGDHLLRAVYMGDATHKASASSLARVRAQASAGTPSFQVSVAPASLTLTAGQTGTVIVSITPENASSLSSPMFVTLSCAGLPDESSCTFTPENIEILSTATAPLTSSMVITTQKASSALTPPIIRKGASPVAWAFLLPGALALAGLAWGGRRRRWLSRLSLLALLGLVSVLGTTACNPRYYYLNHGPPPNPATPSGTFTLDVTGQSSNGVTATTPAPATLVLTVK
jgi:hypothetical protein